METVEGEEEFREDDAGSVYGQARVATRLSQIAPPVEHDRLAIENHGPSWRALAAIAAKRRIKSYPHA